MNSALSTEERHNLLAIIVSLQELFDNLDEIHETMWPIIVAAVGSEYFAEMDADERHKLMITYGEFLRGMKAAMQLLEGEIRRFKKEKAHIPVTDKF